MSTLLTIDTTNPDSGLTHLAGVTISRRTACSDGVYWGQPSLGWEGPGRTPRGAMMEG